MTRYVWMPKLGNVCVEEDRRGIEIKVPTAARVLLQQALDRPTRRVIFFCSCEYPAFCHRKVVGELVLKYAKEQKAPVRGMKWPGGGRGALPMDRAPPTFA